jgi:hypothetical protein
MQAGKQVPNQFVIELVTFGVVAVPRLYPAPLQGAVHQTQLVAHHRHKPQVVLSQQLAHHEPHLGRIVFGD